MDIKIYDGDFEILFTKTVNIYEDKLIFDLIEEFKFIFVFTKDNDKEWTVMNIQGDEENKTVTITLTNFHNTLGASTTRKVKIIETKEGKEIYFSIFAKGLNETSSFLQVTTTFYRK